jgi:hypothetical protein
MSNQSVPPTRAMPKGKHKILIKEILIIAFAWLMAAAAVYLVYVKIKYMLH